MIGIKSPAMDRNSNELKKARIPALMQWIQDNMRGLSWAVPLAMLVLVVGYELGPARWLHMRFGFTYHLAAELLLFATLGPALAFVVLQLLRRWLEERDTSDLQAALLAQTRAEAQGSRQLNDDALQVLFAAGVLIDTLKAGNQSLPPNLLRQVEETEVALQDAVAQLRSHLLNNSN